MKIIAIVLGLVFLAGCSDIPYPPRAITPDSTVEQAVTPPVVPVENKYRLVRTDLNPKVFDFTQGVYDESQSFSVTVEFNSPQHYLVRINAIGTGVVQLSSDETVYGAFYVDSADEYREYILSPLFFPEEEVELHLTTLRGYVKISRISVADTPALSHERYEVSQKLINPDPSAEAAAVFEYLTQQFGSKTLTAQYVTAGSDVEIEAVYKATGRFPAVRLSEFSFNDDEIELMRKYWEKGGIVGFTWYPEREEEEEFLEDIDSMAKILMELGDAKVPVLFNPLPDGGSHLHWWGKYGGDDYAGLWNMIYSRFAFHGVNNVIWVFGKGDYRYYPGDNRVDLVCASVFSINEAQVGSQSARLLLSQKPAMVIASSVLPSPDILARDNAFWLAWGLSRGDFVIDEFGEALSSKSTMLDRFYNHELTICLDNLPIFR